MQVPLSQNSIVENEEFRSLLLTLDPRYQVPSRALISVEIDGVLLDLKGKIQSYLMDAQKVSICADVWTKKGMTTSYLGVTANFFCRSDLKRHVATIEVRRLPRPHTADNINTLSNEEEMDGKAIAIGMSTSPGPEWLKEIVKKVGNKLKVHRELRALLLTSSTQNKGSEVASPATPITPRFTSPCTSNAVSVFLIFFKFGGLPSPFEDSNFLCSYLNLLNCPSHTSG